MTEFDDLDDILDRRNGGPDSHMNLSDAEPPEATGTTSDGRVACLYARHPDADGPAVEVFDPETMEGELRSFPSMDDARDRYRQLTVGEAT